MIGDNSSKSNRLISLFKTRVHACDVINISFQQILEFNGFGCHFRQLL